MNRQYKPQTTAIRAAFLSVATLITILLVGAIDGLAEHYSAGAPVAVSAPVVVAQR